MSHMYETDFHIHSLHDVPDSDISHASLALVIHGVSDEVRCFSLVSPPRYFILVTSFFFSLE